MTKFAYSRGFTIVEVVLFLAISSLLILMATRSIGSRTKTTQFTDAVRSLESFFERRLALVEAGSLVDDNVNCSYNPGLPLPPRYDLVSPSDGSCTFLGYMFEFGDIDDVNSSDPAQHEIFVYQIFGRRLSSTDLALCPDPAEPLICAEPVRVPSTPVERYTIPWQTDVTYTIPNRPKAIGYLRNPVNQSIIPIGISVNAEPVATFEEVFDEPSIYTLNAPLHPHSVVGPQFSSKLCISDREGRAADINFGYQERQEAIEPVILTSETAITCDDNPLWLE